MYKLSPYLCNVPLYKLNINLKETISEEQNGLLALHQKWPHKTSFTELAQTFNVNICF